jgi:hypothetical protein
MTFSRTFTPKPKVPNAPGDLISENVGTASFLGTGVVNNHPPSATHYQDVLTLRQGDTISIESLLQAIDIDGNDLTYTSTGLSPGLTLTPDGKLTVALDASTFNVPANVTLTIDDGQPIVHPGSLTSTEITLTSSASSGSHPWVFQVPFADGEVTDTAKISVSTHQATVTRRWASGCAKLITFVLSDTFFQGVPKTYSITQASTIPVNPTPINVASVSQGATVTASSTFDVGGVSYDPNNVINGDRKGTHWGATRGAVLDSGWSDSTTDSWPDWIQINFASQQQIDEIDVFTLQDSYQNPVEPTPSMTFTQYGITDFDVQYLAGTEWVDVPGGSISGNNLVWKKVSFTPITTNAIRIFVTKALNGLSRIVEVEAWTPAITPPDLLPLDIVSANPQASVNCGANGTVNLSDLLEDPPARIWLQGPEMIECHYHGQVGSSTLHAWFYVRLFKDRRLYIRACVSNSDLETGWSGNDLTYIPTITIGGSVAFNNDGNSLHHYAGTDYMSQSPGESEGWIGHQPQISVKHDITHLIGTGLIPNYSTIWRSRAAEGLDKPVSGFLQGKTPRQFWATRYDPDDNRRKSSKLWWKHQCSSRSRWSIYRRSIPNWAAPVVGCRLLLHRKLTRPWSSSCQL